MKKGMFVKRLISLLAAITILCSFLSVSVLAGTPTLAKNSVVQVRNQNGKEWGSGFAIGVVGEPVQFIVTNNHVVQGFGNTTATVAFDMASNDFVIANVYFSDAEKDIAILKLPQPTDKREAMVLCPMKYADPDDEYAALGYPGKQKTDWPKYNKDDITITKGGIKKADRVNGLDVYMLDLEITNGNSGGPLVNSVGEVVGINSFGFKNAFGVMKDSYAIAIDELLTVIDTERIPVTVHTETNWILIIALAALLIVIILIIVLIVSKSKSKEEVPVVIPTGAAGKTVDVKPPVQPQQGARVIAVGGTLNGKRFTVNGTVRMGRDASQCAIAFPVNTQGVSGVHCEISFDGAVCYVKDLNSRYGTFTVDGKKLDPNVPLVLRHGDKFYLASPENTFEIRF